MLITDDAAAPERFRSMPRVIDVIREGSQFTIHGRGDGFITEVIQCLAEHRVHVTSFRAEQPNLEDVFLKLTGHRIRD